jgi:hypothetical protein
MDVLDEMAEFSIVTRASSSARIPEPISAAGPEVTEMSKDVPDRGSASAFGGCTLDLITGSGRFPKERFAQGALCAHAGSKCFGSTT